MKNIGSKSGKTIHSSLVSIYRTFIQSTSYTTLNSSRTEESETTKCTRSFAFAFECSEALGEPKFNTPSLHIDERATRMQN